MLLQNLFVLQIKGMSWSESKAEANQYMLDLGIEAKANTSSSKLSGM
jgi:hypothetical protein